MRNLSESNPSISTPKYTFWMGLGLAFFSGLIGWAFGKGAGHGDIFSENIIEMSGLFLCSLAVLASLIPLIFKWDWKSKYFGAVCFPFSTVSLIGLYPAICFYYYGTCSIYIRIFFLLANMGLIFWWCRRFFVLYKKIMANPEFFSLLYAEEADAYYYLQKNDVLLIEKKLHVAQFPTGILTWGPMLSAIFLLPFSSAVSKFAGIPFIHIFLAIFALPIELMCLGFVSRGFLIFFYYPNFLYRRTGKSVYVDLTSKR